MGESTESIGSRYLGFPTLAVSTEPLIRRADRSSEIATGSSAASLQSEQVKVRGEQAARFPLPRALEWWHQARAYVPVRAAHSSSILAGIR